MKIFWNSLEANMVAGVVDAYLDVNEISDKRCHNLRLFLREQMPSND